MPRESLGAARLAAGEPCLDGLRRNGRPAHLGASGGAHMPGEEALPRWVPEDGDHGLEMASGRVVAC